VENPILPIFFIPLPQLPGVLSRILGVLSFIRPILDLGQSLKLYHAIALTNAKQNQLKSNKIIKIQG
jgi:hypothetical protein